MSKIEIIVGQTTFRSIIADANALWRVTKARGNDTYECVVEDIDYNGTKRVFGGEEIRAAVQYSKNLDKMFEDSENWYENLTVGQIVHYHDSFGRYVRCEVVRGVPERRFGSDDLTVKNLLQPIALVGAWEKYDLPKRRPNGDIDYGYHAEKVINRTGAWQPHESNVFENSSYAYRKSGVDPRNLPAIDLTVPEPSAEEAELIRLTKLRDEVVKMLNDYDSTRKVEDLRDVFERAAELLEEGAEA